MVAKLVVAPLPAPVGTIVSVTGTGFNNRVCRVLLDGVVSATDFRAAKGRFEIGVQVAKVVKSQTLEVEQKQPGGNWTVVARLAPLLTFSPATPDTAGPVITSTQAIAVTEGSFVVSWQTNEPSTSVVNYGPTAAYGSSASNASLVTTHSVTVTGLSASTLYHYRVRSTDAAGNEVVGGDLTVTTLAGGITDTTAPVISAVLVSAITATTARVTWTTDEPSNAQVEYGLTTAYGTLSTLDASFTQTAHSISLAGLTVDTTYQFRVRSADASSNLAVSANSSFTATDVPAEPDSTYLAMIKARSGVLGAWLFGGDSGSTFLDRSPAANHGTWSNPPVAAVSPIPNDTASAVTLLASDVGTVPRISAYNRSNGPFGIEFWVKASGSSLLTEMLADSPTMLLRGNEASGTTANDASTSGTHDGTLGTDVTFGAAALVGTETSMDFSGASVANKLTVPDHAAFDRGDGAFTFSAVLKRDTIGTTMEIADKGLTGGTSWQLYISSGNIIAFVTKAGANLCESASTFTDTTSRHMLTVTYDGTSAKMYLDGADITGSSANATIADSTDQLVIGSTQTFGNRYDGRMAYIGFYPTAVSAARIATWWAAIDGAGGPDHYVVSASNFVDDGWAIRSASGLMSLTNATGTANIRTTTAATPGWHHYAINRGSDATSVLYQDGVDVTTVVGAVTFSSAIADLLVTADGGIYGLVYYNRVITAAEAAESAGITYVDDTSQPIQGYGANVTGGTGQTDYHVTTLSPTGAGSIMDALSASNRNIIFDVTGTIALSTSSIQYVTGRSNFTLDGGGVITLTGAPLWFRTGCSNYIIRNIRHAGGWTGDPQSGDNFTNVGSTDYVYQHVSVRGYTDEGISSSSGCADYTIQDCLFAEGDQPSDGHDFSSLNSATRGSFIRNAMISTEYRNPQLESGLFDVVNNVHVGLSPGATSYSFSLFNSAKVNATNCYHQDVTDPVTKDTTVQLWHTGARLVSSGSMPASYGTKHTIPAYAQVPSPLTGTAAAAYAKANAGSLPHNAADTTSLAKID